jgi:hypothetical protein
MLTAMRGASSTVRCCDPALRPQTVYYQLVITVPRQPVLFLGFQLVYSDFKAAPVCSGAVFLWSMGRGSRLWFREEIIDSRGAFTPRDGSGRARIYAMRGFPEPHDERPVFIGVRDVWNRFHEIRRISARICKHPLQ